MYWRDICNLCTETEKTDSLGKPYKVFERHEVFCNEKGVKRNEFYQAQAQGYRPELCVEIKATDYNRETATKFVASLVKVFKGAWAEYRQQLRDIPEQADFPFNITFPTPPDSIEEE